MRPSRFADKLHRERAERQRHPHQHRRARLVLQEVHFEIHVGGRTFQGRQYLIRLYRFLAELDVLVPANSR